MGSPGRLARALGAVGAAAAVAALAACDTGDGRELRAPPPGATVPPLPTSTTAPPPQAGPAVGSEATPLALASGAFAEGGTIPARHTCDGEGVSPSLSWSGVPEGTVELALTMVDPDAPGAPFVHLDLAGIDPVVTGIGEGGVPETAVEVQPWIGPCPPAGENHRYVFTLYALTEPSGIEHGDAVDAALAALESTPGPTATLTAFFVR